MRPKHNFTPGKHWMNDPNGLCYFNDKYHMFYQYFPYGTSWGTMHWGHATSKDLMNWEEHDIALFPSNLHDQNGVFSGSAVIENETMHLFYTGVRYQKPNPNNIHTPSDGTFFTSTQLKISSKDGFSFDNYNDKRVVIPPIVDENIGDEIHTRDPKVWKHGNYYYMLLGTRVKKNGVYKGKLLFYKAPNLIDFKLVCEYDGIHIGNMWECPDYFEVNGQGCLIMSPENFIDKEGVYPSHPMIFKAKFDYDNDTFEILGDGSLLDYGMQIYAPQTFLDEDGNRVLISWIRMKKVQEEGYVGMMTIPKIITYENEQFVFKPIEAANEIYANIGETNEFNIPSILDVKANSDVLLLDLKVIDFVLDNPYGDMKLYYYEDNGVIDLIINDTIMVTMLSGDYL